MAKKKSSASRPAKKSSSKSASKSTPSRKKTTTKSTAAKTSTRKKTTAKKAVTGRTSPAGKSVKKKTTGKSTAPKAAADKSSGEAKKVTTRKKASTATRKVADVSTLKGYDKTADAATRHEPLSDAQLRKVKTGLTRKDLNYFKQQLLERRADILHDVGLLEQDAQNGSGEGISYEHMADAGSDNFEQEFTLGLMESERKTLAEINEALVRIANGTYGVCIETGQPISKARLEAKPWAKYTIEVAMEKEKRGEL